MSDETKNWPETIKDLYASRGLSWSPVIFFLPARMIFAFLAQGLTAGLFASQGSSDAWRDAAAWWPVYSTITDVFCLLCLIWLTRREGRTLGDLVGVTGRSMLKQLAWTPAYLLAVAPGAILASFITQAYYGTAAPPYLSIVHLTPAGAIYSLIIWPVIWVITEELVYLGYLLPRLEALFGRTWLAVLVVIVFWGLQHLAIPFLPDGTYLVARVIAAMAAVSGFAVVFVLWRRRLIPLIGAHYIADLSTAIIVGLLPLLQG
jgi:membrane protease YdiL (CAAX protease family)